MRVEYVDPDYLVAKADRRQFEGFPASIFEMDACTAPSNSLLRKLSIAINRLPPKQRRIMQLCRKGLSNREIAQKVRISDCTVSLQKKAAIQKLKECFFGM